MAADVVAAVRPDYRPVVKHEWTTPDAVAPIDPVVDQIIDLGGLNFNPADIPQTDGGPANGGEQTDNPAFPNGLPVLHSNRGATHTIYLNFTGNTVTQDWETEFGNLKGMVTSPYDTDGDARQFDVNEQYAIRQIWEIVAEDYAPFDVDVTTDYHGPFENGKALQVAIGGTDRDELILGKSTGITHLDGFATDAELPSLVFTSSVHREMAYSAAAPELKSKGLDGQLPAGERQEQKQEIIARYMKEVDWETIVAIGNTASHESGHAFGLVHDELLKDGAHYEPYNPGTDAWTPIMGQNTSTDRHTWSLPDKILQDEVSILTEHLGARLDDHPDGDATPLVAADSGLQFDGSGVISTLQDADAFSFRVQYDGVYHVAVDVPQNGNLDSRFEVYAGEDLVGEANNFDRLSESGDFQLEAGRDYLLVVKSNGAYGDLGNYKVSVTWPIAEIGPIAEVPPLVDYPDGDPANPAEDKFGDPASQYIPDGSDASFWDTVWGTVGVNDTPYASYQKSTPKTADTSIYDSVFSGLNSNFFNKVGSYNRY